jgi:predicted DNA-binding antitoxin AbrB/MazE fold protein
MMSNVALEGVVEKGVIRPVRPLGLAEGTKVYIVVPEIESRPPTIESPRLVHPEQVADFRMEVSEG